MPQIAAEDPPPASALRNLGPVGEWVTQGCSLRLRPRTDAESSLTEAAHRGRVAANRRIMAELPGLDLVALRQQCGTTTARLLTVSDGMLKDLDGPKAVDHMLRSLDGTGSHLRLVNGSQVEPIPQRDAIVSAARADTDINRVRPAAAVDATQEGVTMILNHVHPRIGGRLSRFVHDLTRVAGAAVGVNVYVSEREAPGFGRHWDDHDVLIVQCRGAKHWTLHEPRELAPSKGYVSRDSAGKEVFSTVLEPGSVLYIPRGWSHAVRGFPGEVSMHYTISVSPPTSVDVVHALLGATQGRGRRPVHDLPRITRSTFEAAVAFARAGIPTDGDTGLFQVADAVENDWEGVVVRAPAPGGAVFADRVGHRSKDGDGGQDGVVVAISGSVISLPDRFLPALSSWFEGDVTSIGDLVGLTGLDRAAVVAAVRALAALDVVHLDEPAE